MLMPAELSNYMQQLDALRYCCHHHHSLKRKSPSAPNPGSGSRKSDELRSCRCSTTIRMQSVYHSPNLRAETFCRRPPQDLGRIKAGHVPEIGRYSDQPVVFIGEHKNSGKSRREFSTKIRTRKETRENDRMYTHDNLRTANYRPIPLRGHEKKRGESLGVTFSTSELVRSNSH